jgi:hypothetical protein
MRTILALAAASLTGCTALPAFSVSYEPTTEAVTVTVTK